MGLYTYDDNSILRGLIRGGVYLIVVISIAWFLVYGFLGQTIINGQSMAPLLHAEDVCLINRLSYDLGNPKRYDIVLFERSDSSKLNVKRVVGLPGETVQVVNNAIYIDGERLSDERIQTISLPGIAENAVELGPEEYFVIGDNPDSSEDSRFANIGNVTRDSMKGKIWFKLKPFSDIGLIR